MFDIVANVEAGVEVRIRIEVVPRKDTRDIVAIVLGADLLNEGNLDVTSLEVPEKYARLLIHAGDVPLDDIGRGSIQTSSREIGGERNMRRRARGGGNSVGVM